MGKSIDDEIKLKKEKEEFLKLAYQMGFLSEVVLNEILDELINFQKTIDSDNEE